MLSTGFVPRLYKEAISQAPRVRLGLFADVSCIYVCDTPQRHYILRKLQRGLSATEAWCQRWDIKINEDKTKAIYASHSLRPPEAHLTLYGRNIPFVNYVKYLGVTFEKIKWRLCIEMNEEGLQNIYYNSLPL
jgi:hypothetical protein